MKISRRESEEQAAGQIKQNALENGAHTILLGILTGLGLGIGFAAVSAVLKRRK